MEDDSLNFDWSQISSLFRPNFSHIPGDVTFKVLDEEDQVVATFEAHKVILAVHSNYLKDIFFGSGVFKRGSNVMPTVVIKGTSKGAFKEFLGFFYEEKIDFEEKSLSELYEILKLAKKFQLLELKEKVAAAIKNCPLSIENCVTFLRKQLPPSSVSDISISSKKKNNVVDKLVLLNLNIDTTSQEGRDSQSPDSFIFKCTALHPGALRCEATFASRSEVVEHLKSEHGAPSYFYDTEPSIHLLSASSACPACDRDPEEYFPFHFPFFDQQFLKACEIFPNIIITC